MTPHPRLSGAGIELVKRFEGFRPRALRLDGGGWTIGYGHTASAREGAQVTEAEGEALLIYDLDRVARAIDPLVFTPLSRNQFNALVAFAFNVGVDAFRRSAVLKRVNEGELLQAAAALELWRRAELHGESLVLDALVRRRAAEKALFLTPPEDFRPASTPLVRPLFDAAAHALIAEATGLARVAQPASAEEPDPIDEAVQGLTTRFRALFPDEALPPAPSEPAPSAPTPSEPAPSAPTPSEPVVTAAEPGFSAPPPPERASGPAPLEAPEPDLRSWPVERSPRRRRRSGPPVLVLLVGAAGAAMFVVALLAMIYGRATVANLAVGLMGVVCMVPAGVVLLARAFGERPDL